MRRDPYLNLRVSPLLVGAGDGTADKDGKDERTDKDNSLLVGNVDLLADGDGGKSGTEGDPAGLADERVAGQSVEDRAGAGLGRRLVAVQADGSDRGGSTGSDGGSRKGEGRDPTSSDTERHDDDDEDRVLGGEEDERWWRIKMMVTKRVRQQRQTAKLEESQSARSVGSSTQLDSTPFDSTGIGSRIARWLACKPNETLLAQASFPSNLSLAHRSLSLLSANAARCALALQAPNVLKLAVFFLLFT